MQFPRIRISRIADWKLIPCLFVLVIIAEFSWEYPDGNDNNALRTMQMLIKAAFYAMLGLIAVWRFSKRISVPQVMLREFGLFVGLCCWFTLMSVQTATIGRSMASAASMVCVAIYMFSLFATRDPELTDKVIHTVKWATGFIIVSSCILAVLKPDQFLVTKDYFQGITFRLRGIMGHPNALARPEQSLYSSTTSKDMRSLSRSVRR